MDILDNFKIYSQNNETLITPSYTTKDNIWHSRNSLLRSCHIDYSNRIISLGFPKFFNLGQCPESEISVTLDDLLKTKSEILATLKFDGSLLLRYVKNGKVKFRTRGCLSIGLECLEEELPELLNKYPELSNPNLYTNDTILFEYISHENQIVIKYTGNDLVLIGGMKYNKNISFHSVKPILFNIDEMRDASTMLGVPLVHHFVVSDVSKFIETQIERTDIEGYVLRFGYGQKLVKIKTRKYILLHSMKSEMSVGKIIDLWILWEQPSYTQFKNKFIETFDWECWSFILPMASCVFDSINTYTNMVNHINIFVDRYKKLNRKDFAIKCSQTYNGNSLAMCFSFLDNKNIKENIVKKIIIQNLKRE